MILQILNPAEMQIYFGYVARMEYYLGINQFMHDETNFQYIQLDRSRTPTAHKLSISLSASAIISGYIYWVLDTSYAWTASVSVSFSAVLSLR